MNIAIITSGYLPVPATRGGAVETIVEDWMKVNENYNDTKFIIFTIYDKDAEKEIKKYKNSEAIFIKKNGLINFFDKLIYGFAKYVLKKQRVMSYRYILQRLYFLNKVSKNIKKNNYDKILLENHPTLFLALKWRKNYKKYEGKYYYHLHNEQTKLYGCKDIIKNCKKILCVSNFIKNNIKTLTGRADNVYVLKNCVDNSLFDLKMSDKEKNKLKEKYNIKKDETVLLFTGRVSAEKGINELLLAINKIKDEKFKLIIVGSFFFDTNIKNNFDAKLKQYVDKAKDKVVFTGFVKHNEIAKLYNISDIAVLPSIVNDAAPLTILESMASGLPIITTNSGGIPEYAKGGCAIILERDKNLVNNLASSISSLVKDKSRRDEMAKISITNSKELTLDKFYNNLIEELK